MSLFDNHGRPLNYLRLAVTDRCNLRCFYCMPAEGIRYLPKKELMTYEEMERMVRLFASMGISKIRITGGEPFVRTDIISFIQNIVEIPGVKDLHITTNGVLTAEHVPTLKKIGVGSVNLSLDTLDRHRFHQITLRDEFDKVSRTFNLLMDHDIPVKINAVVMDNKNIEDIYPLIELTRDKNISVRFIEEMPFNGGDSHYQQLMWNYQTILDYIRQRYPDLVRLPDPANSTAYHYQVAGYRGNIGIIAAFSRTFCGTCNRLRVTAQGTLKTCLYDGGSLNIKAMMRMGMTDDDMTHELKKAFSNRAANGFEAEQRTQNKSVYDSMSTIGG